MICLLTIRDRGELAAEMVLEVSLPDSHQPIPKGMQIRFPKSATTDITVTKQPEKNGRADKEKVQAPSPWATKAALPSSTQRPICPDRSGRIHTGRNLTVAFALGSRYEAEAAGKYWA